MFFIIGPITLEVVLYFFSGAEEIPPMGYGSLISPCVHFFLDEEPYPKASTCAIELKLPTRYHQGPYSLFKEAMDIGMLCHGGFGLA